MTHDELLAKIVEKEPGTLTYSNGEILHSTRRLVSWQLALRAIVELHKPQEITLPDGSWGTNCKLCDGWSYPCLTIDIIRHAF